MRYRQEFLDEDVEFSPASRCLSAVRWVSDDRFDATYWDLGGIRDDEPERFGSVVSQVRSCSSDHSWVCICTDGSAAY